MICKTLLDIQAKPARIMKNIKIAKREGLEG
jgi:hypothetical protein